MSFVENYAVKCSMPLSVHLYARGNTLHTTVWLQGKNIRYVHIPDDIDIMKTIEEQVKMYTPGGPAARTPKLTAEEKKRKIKEEKKKKLDSAVEAMRDKLAGNSSKQCY